MTPEVYLVIEAKIKNELENLHALEGELAAYGLYPTVSVTSVGGFALTDAAAVRIVAPSCMITTQPWRRSLRPWPPGSIGACREARRGTRNSSISQRYKDHKDNHIEPQNHRGDRREKINKILLSV